MTCIPQISRGLIRFAPKFGPGIVGSSCVSTIFWASFDRQKSLQFNKNWCDPVCAKAFLRFPLPFWAGLQHGHLVCWWKPCEGPQEDWPLCHRVFASDMDITIARYEWRPWSPAHIDMNEASKHLMRKHWWVAVIRFCSGQGWRRCDYFGGYIMIYIYIYFFFEKQTLISSHLEWSPVATSPLLCSDDSGWDVLISCGGPDDEPGGVFVKSHLKFHDFMFVFSLN